MKITISLLLIMFVINPGMTSAQDVSEELPSEALIVIHDNNSGINRLVRADASGNVVQTLLELEQVSSKMAKDYLSLEEVAIIEEVFQQDAREILNQQLRQILNRVWQIGRDKILLEITNSVCGIAGQRLCFGYTEYGMLTSDGYTPIISVDFHGDTHRNGNCVYQEILSSHDVRFHKENGVISITVKPVMPCVSGIQDIYTLYFKMGDPEVSSPIKIPGAVGFSSTAGKIAYYQLQCDATECEVTPTVGYLDESDKLIIDTYSVPLHIATLLDLKWTNENTVFYQQFIPEPQARYQFYTFSTNTEEATLLFSDYSLWQQVFTFDNRLVGFWRGSGTIVTSDPLMVITDNVYQIIDTGNRYLLYTENQGCITIFTLLQSDFSTLQFNAQELFDTNNCIIDIALVSI